MFSVAHDVNEGPAGLIDCVSVVSKCDVTATFEVSSS